MRRAASGGQERSRLRGALPLPGLCAIALCVGACGSSDPNKPLTADEGAALVRGIQSGKTHVRDMSPVEKAYIRDRLAK